jgi:hypothetical protein
VHPGKSCAVAWGTLDPSTPGTTTAIPIKTTTTSLGVTVSNLAAQPLVVLRQGLRGTVRDPPAQSTQISPAWHKRLHSVQTMCNMVKGLHLSAMGRGLAASGYALSKVLFHAEHEGLPVQVEDKLRRIMANTTDNPRRVPGIHSSLLPGSPAIGGFGVLPVGEHTTARHAKTASALLRTLMGIHDPTARTPTWIPIAAGILRQICPSLHPVQTLLLASFATQAHIHAGRLTGLPTQAFLIPTGPLRNMAIALQRLGHLRFHPDFQTSATMTPQELLSVPSPTPQSLFHRIRGLVWQNQLRHPLPQALGPVGNLTVKGVTEMQLGSTLTHRHLAIHAYTQQAFASTPTIPPIMQDVHEQTFVKSLKTIWKIPWDNTNKEILWRLIVNGVQGAGGHNICHRTPCCCTFALTPAQLQAHDGAAHRQHCFWDCPVAQAVLQELRRGLPGIDIRQYHLWLLQSPGVGVQTVVWRVVALAALTAMEHGRRCLWHHALQHQATQAASVTHASSRAAAHFWLLLHDFARTAQYDANQGWAAVRAGHPYLQVHNENGNRTIRATLME